MDDSLWYAKEKTDVGQSEEMLRSDSSLSDRRLIKQMHYCWREIDSLKETLFMSMYLNKHAQIRRRK
jgi:hypothetical protein